MSSGAVIRKGGVHHLKPDSQAMDQCLMERVYLPTYLGVCVCECQSILHVYEYRVERALEGIRVRVNSCINV